MGKLFTFTLKDVCDVIERRIANKFDCLIVIDGDRGMSKSTLSYKICYKVKIKHPFKPRRDLIYSISDALRHLASKTEAILLLDEMIMVTYNRDFYKDDNKQFIKGLNVYRDSCNLIIMCVPNFDDLDVQIRELCTLRITCVRRGIGLIQSPKKSLYTRDRWDFKGNAKIEAEWINSKTKNPKFSKLSTAIGLVHYGDLTSQQQEEYKAIKREKRNKMFAGNIDESMLSDPDKLFISNLASKVKEGKLTPEMLKTICEVNGKNERTIRSRINNMLKEEGTNLTTKDLVLSDKAKKRKDLLGFVLPNLSEDKPNIATKKANAQKPSTYF